MYKIFDEFLERNCMRLGKAFGRLLKNLPQSITIKISKLLRKCEYFPVALRCPVTIFAYNVIKFMYFANKTPVILKKVLFDGSIMKLDITDHTQQLIYLWKLYEPPTTKYINTNLREGEIFIDIGANVGYYTLLTAKIVGPSGKVYAFEPEVKNFLALKTNLSINNIKNAMCYQKAVADRVGTMKLNLNPLNKGGHSLNQFEQYSGDASKSYTLQEIKVLYPNAKFQQEVSVITMDEFLSQMIDSSFDFSDISLIKVDVEGAEVNVLRGMQMLLSLDRAPKIICEVSSKNCEEINSILAKFGFKVFNLSNNGQPMECMLEEDMCPGNFVFIKE
ncbi:MAG: FkbM family methyltransferase [Candidatus Omnitrophica bacterium]|nr:FkbM family methyltransferase [Candidatus Omnitrophota bacterium]